MSRKSLIICLAVLAVMIVGIGISVAVLYSGTDNSKDKEMTKVAGDSRFLLLPAVPSDAVMLCCFSDAEKVSQSIYGNSAFPSKLKESGARLGRMTASLHFAGKLYTLYVLDLGKAASQPSVDAEAVMEAAEDALGCAIHM